VTTLEYPTQERNETIVARVTAGESLQAVANDYGVSRERIRQICKANGSRSTFSPVEAKLRWQAKFKEWTNDPNALPGLARLPMTAKRLPGYTAMAMLVSDRRRQLRQRPERISQIVKMQELAAELGRTPRSREYRKRFGSWRQDRWGNYNQLVVAAGLTPVPPGSPGHLPQERNDLPDAVPVSEAVAGECQALALEQSLHRITHP